MIVDALTEFCTALPIAGATILPGTGTNFTIDLQNIRDMVIGEPLYVQVVVTGSFASGASPTLTIACGTDSDPALASGNAVYLASETYTLAQLQTQSALAGLPIHYMGLSVSDAWFTAGSTPGKRYLGLLFTPSGTFSGASALTCRLVNRAMTQAATLVYPTNQTVL